MHSLGSSVLGSDNYLSSEGTTLVNSKVRSALFRSEDCHNSLARGIRCQPFLQTGMGAYIGRCWAHLQYTSMHSQTRRHILRLLRCSSRTKQFCLGSCGKRMVSGQFCNSTENILSSGVEAFIDCRRNLVSWLWICTQTTADTYVPGSNERGVPRTRSPNEQHKQGA
jgi:hypothetical protein